ESAIANFALAKYSLSGYVLIRVCKPKRPTSCRPCLISFMALSYNCLSGSTVLLVSVDLSTGFFLCKIWAVHWLAVTSVSAHMRRSANRRNLHLSFELLVPGRSFAAGLGIP